MIYTKSIGAFTLAILSQKTLNLLIAFLIMLVPFVHDEEVPSATPHPVTTQKDPPLIISEKDFVSIVIVESESVRLQKLDVLISEQGIKNAESIFEPYLEFGYGLDYGFEQNNTEQAVVRSSRAEFEHRDNIYSAAISGLLPTGAEYKMFYDLDDPSNSHCLETLELI